MTGASRTRKLLLACACLVLLAGVADAGVPEPYHEILRANADGTNLELVLPRERALAAGGIEIDPGLGPDPMYWVAWDPFDPGGFVEKSDLVRAGRFRGRQGLPHRFVGLHALRRAGACESRRLELRDNLLARP